MAGKRGRITDNKERETEAFVLSDVAVVVVTAEAALDELRIKR